MYSDPTYEVVNNAEVICACAEGIPSARAGGRARFGLI